jgi:hypothetical protein
MRGTTTCKYRAAKTDVHFFTLLGLASYELNRSTALDRLLSFIHRQTALESKNAGIEI